LCSFRKTSAAIGEKKIHRGVDCPDSMMPSQFHLLRTKVCVVRRTISTGTMFGNYWPTGCHGWWGL